MNEREFGYRILSPKSFLEKESLSLVNQAFSLWWKTWNPLYKNSEFKLKPEEFLRHDLLCVVTHKDKVIASHLYSFYDLLSQCDVMSHYFQFFSEDYIQKIKSKDIRNVMSMEYLTVDPEYRSATLGLSLGKVLGQLGTRVFERTDAGAIVAPARKDLKVHEMAYDSGFTCLEPDVNQRGFLCDMIAYFKGNGKNLSDLKAAKFCDYLWENVQITESRESYLTQAPKIIPKAA